MAQRLHIVPTQADKRVSQLSQMSESSVNSNSSDARRHKAHIGPWRLGRTLGRGSSGRVRLAKHSVTGQLAAVKIVPKGNVSSVSQENKGNHRAGTLPYGIEREVVIMKLIEHPNVMRLYDVWENRGELYLVLEYIEGGELFDYLVQRGRLPEHEAVDYLQQILNAVDYCHRYNICHRDLKPENLLFDKDKNIKVADFGMAALESKGQLLQTSCGSPHYASPEIVNGDKYHGAPSDIWSCGIILHALLTGGLPFDDEDIRVLLLKVKAGHFDMPHGLSRHAKDLIWRMLDVNPETRIKMPEIMAHPLLKKYQKSHDPRLPRAPTVEELGTPVRSISEIDREILKNLQTLWTNQTRESIAQKLLYPGPCAEKTFYCLLLKYRRDRLENYRGDDKSGAIYNSERMIKSASKKSMQSRKSTSSAKRNGEHSKSNSKSSQVTATSVHKRGISFSRNKKRKDLAPAMERERHTTVVRQPPLPHAVIITTPIQAFDLDQSTREMSAEFSQMLDMAFNSSPTNPSLLPGPFLTNRPLPSAPVNQYTSGRPNSADLCIPIDTNKQKAHKSTEATAAAVPLPRIFEEEKERFADADENTETGVSNLRTRRPKPTKQYSYPVQKQNRPVLGELNASNVSNMRPTSRSHPAKREADSRLRISSMLESDTPRADDVRVDRRLVSAPAMYGRLPSEIGRTMGKPIEERDMESVSRRNRNWFGRKKPALAIEKTIPPILTSPYNQTNTIEQATLHIANPVNLAARRAAPRPPQIKTVDKRGEWTDAIASSTPPPIKQSFFARLLHMKPASRSLYSTCHTAKLYREIAEALGRWQASKLGITALEEDRQRKILRARLANKNALGLKSVRFRIEIREYEQGSQAVFFQEKGAASSFDRIVQEYELIFRQAGVLFEVRPQSRLSAYAI